jgi:hypothetical protein
MWRAIGPVTKRGASAGAEGGAGWSMRRLSALAGCLAIANCATDASPDASSGRHARSRAQVPAVL